MTGDEMQKVAIEAECERKQAAAKSYRVSDDCLVDRLRVRERRTDHAQHFGGCRLLLSRFR
jgi:hypothetical protein